MGLFFHVLKFYSYDKESLCTLIHNDKNNKSFPITCMSSTYLLLNTFFSVIVYRIKVFFITFLLYKHVRLKENVYFQFCILLIWYSFVYDFSSQLKKQFCSQLLNFLRPLTTLWLLKPPFRKIHIKLLCFYGVCRPSDPWSETPANA